MKRLRGALIGAFALIACLLSHAQAESTLDVNALIDEALKNNPDIAAYQKKKDAMWERPPQAKAWEDPRLMLGVTNVPADDADFRKEDMTQKEISLSQQIPFPGITALREKIAVQEAQSADQELEDMRLRVARDLKKAYYDLCFINTSAAITEKNRGLLEKLVDITLARYEVGRGLQQDILKARVELSRFMEKLIELQQQKASAASELNRLLGRAPEASLEGEPSAETKPLSLSRLQIEQAAIANSAALLRLQHQIEKGRAEHALAKKAYFPDFNVAASYGFRENQERGKGRAADRPDMFSFVVGVNIPIWFKDKQNRKAAETYYLIDEAQAQYNAAKNEILFKISDLTAKKERDLKLIELYKAGIIPQAAQALDSALAGYQVGSIDFQALLDSQISHCTSELQCARVMSEYAKDLAELEAVVGKRLF